MKQRLLFAALLVCAAATQAQVWLEKTQEYVSDQHYISFYEANPNHPLRCAVGQAAQMNGDHRTALKIWRECAERGNVIATISLAMYLELGIGTKANPSEARDLYRQAASLEDSHPYSALGKYHYGVAILNGIGAAPDAQTARVWLQKSADLGEPSAAALLLNLSLSQNNQPATVRH